MSRRRCRRTCCNHGTFWGLSTNGSIRSRMHRKSDLAVTKQGHDMRVMRKILAAFLIGVAVPVAGAAYGQVGYQPPGMQPVIPYPTAPAPIPPPRIEVPVVPQMSNPPPFALQNTTPGTVGQGK